MQALLLVEQKSEHRAEYGKQVLKELPKRLTKEFGKGFSRSNLQWMRILYLKYPICQTLSNKLSWSHYCELLTISDDAKRSFYEQECINAHWSFRELKRQIDSSLFERLLLSDGQANKERVMQLATKGVEMANIGYTLCCQIDVMMNGYLATLEERFRKEGGIKERMHRVRTGYRAEQDRKMREMETTIRWQEERIRQLEAELKRIKEDGRG